MCVCVSTHRKCERDRERVLFVNHLFPSILHPLNNQHIQHTKRIRIQEQNVQVHNFHQKWTHYRTTSQRIKQWTQSRALVISIKCKNDDGWKLGWKKEWNNIYNNTLIYSLSLFKFLCHFAVFNCIYSWSFQVVCNG